VGDADDLVVEAALSILTPHYGRCTERTDKLAVRACGYVLADLVVEDCAGTPMEVVWACERCLRQR
jgi:hypothetical protein